VFCQRSRRFIRPGGIAGKGHNGRSRAGRFASSRLPSSQTPRRSPVDLDRGRRSDPGAGVADHHVPEAPAARIASPRGGISAGRALPRRPANVRLPERVGAPEPVDHRGGPDGTEDEGDGENDRQRNGLENSHCPSIEGGLSGRSRLGGAHRSARTGARPNRRESAGSVGFGALGDAAP
jgi:hypothetical protein